MRSLERLTVSTALVLLAASSGARADAIGGPPASCPDGSHGVSSHSGSWCEPADCNAATDCAQVMAGWSTPTPPAAGRYTCQPRVGLCVHTDTIPEGGRVPVPSMITRREARSVCHAASDCPADAPCELAARCAEDPSWTSPASPASGTFWRRAFSCDDGASPPTRVGGLFLGLGGLGLATVLVRRRRR